MTRTVTKTLRLIEMVEMMKRRPRGVGELAARFGTTRRTIERDLDDLRDTEYAPREADHRYAIPTRTGALNQVEALAVHSAARLLVHTGVGERHYRAALEKTAQYLPDPARGTLLSAVERLRPAPEDRNLDLVAQAWFDRRVLRCEYHSFSAGTRRTCALEVYFLEINRRNLDAYVLAFDRVREELRMFKLVRMRNAHLTHDAYEIPDDFDPHEHLAGAWGVTVRGEPVTITLRAKPGVARWFYEAATRDPQLEVLEQDDDGSVRVALHANLAEDGSPHEVSAFLLGWGANVEAQEPESVRTWLREAFRAAADTYA